MIGRLTLSLVVLGAMLAARAAPAQADGQVLVVEFSGAGDEDLAQLTQEMADVLRAEGGEVTVASREDVLTLAGCPDTSDDDCLRDALGVLGAERIVLGEVRASSGSAIEVDLKIIAADAEPRSRVLRITGSGDDIAPAFRLQAGAFWRGEESPQEPEEAPPEEAAEAAPPASDPPAAGGVTFSSGRVEPYTWWIAGGGAGMLAAGALLLVAARGKQSDVDDAPTDTVEDLEELEDLESSGRSYARWGGALTVVGAVGVLVGGVLVYRQGRRPPADADDAAVSLRPTLSPDAFGLSLMVRTP